MLNIPSKLTNYKAWKEPILCHNGWNWLSGSREGKESIKFFFKITTDAKKQEINLELWFGEFKITEIAKDGPHGFEKKMLSIKFTCHI